MNEHFTGVAIDPRLDSEKAKDWQHEELFGMGSYTWKEFNEADIPQYTIRNQNGSGMCGAFSGGKAVGINNKKDVGEFYNTLNTFIYYHRANKPQAGMYMQDIFDIVCKYGVPQDPALVSDNLTEEQANAFVPTKAHYDDAIKYKGKSYVFIDKNNLDGIAQAIESGFTPVILLRCAIREWTSEPFVDTSVVPSEWNINHFVPLIYAGLRNGVKTFVCDDSWGSSYGKNGRRFISENFIKNRVWQVGYIVDSPNVPQNTGPHHTFTKWLTYGMMNDPDVKALQDILKYEGCLDTTVNSTGNYLNQTAQAVMKLQLKNQIATPQEVAKLAGKQVGPKTLAYLKKYI